jgi:hypothetical protein
MDALRASIADAPAADTRRKVSRKKPPVKSVAKTAEKKVRKKA